MIQKPHFSASGRVLIRPTRYFVSALQKMISMHDKYCVDIYQPEHEQAVVAILVTLQHMIKDREARSASFSSSSSGSSSN